MYLNACALFLWVNSLSYSFEPMLSNAHYSAFPSWIKQPLPHLTHFMHCLQRRNALAQKCTAYHFACFPMKLSSVGLWLITPGSSSFLYMTMFLYLSMYLSITFKMSCDQYGALMPFSFCVKWFFFLIYFFLCSLSNHAWCCDNCLTVS